MAPPHRAPVAAALALAAAAVATLALAGCGSSAGSGAGSRGLPTVSLVLDFTPNAVHAGIYSAIARGFDRAEGVRLRVITPAASADSIDLLERGRATFAILDIHDLAIARERGADPVAVMALIERPLAAVLAAPAVATPRQLQGRTVGVTGDPSDAAVLRSILIGDRVSPRRVSTVTIGFDAVAALLSGRVAAATGFWNDEGVSLRRRDPAFHVFRLEQFGAPAYPELVLCTAATTLKRRPGLVRAVVRALERGYGVTLRDPAASAADLEARVPGLDPALVGAELAAEEPAFRGADGRFGELDPAVLQAWSRWEVRFGIVSRRPDVAAAFAPGVASAGARR